MISIQIDTTGLRELRDMLEAAPHGFHAAVARSLNRAAESAAVAVSRELARETGAGVRAVRREVQVTRYAQPEDLTAEITISGKPLPLSAFAPRDVAAGVSVRTLGGPARGVAWAVPHPAGRAAPLVHASRPRALAHCRGRERGRAGRVGHKGGRGEAGGGNRRARVRGAYRGRVGSRSRPRRSDAQLQRRRARSGGLNQCLGSWL
jgi:hypothetical protein